MTIVTDSIQVKNGTDFSFVCGKVPFAISCSSTLTHGAYNLIDLDLVNKMKIPLQKIKVCRMTYLGENMRSVGYIDQTVHCVHKGVIQGTRPCVRRYKFIVPLYQGEKLATFLIGAIITVRQLITSLRHAYTLAVVAGELTIFFIFIRETSYPRI